MADIKNVVIIGAGVSGLSAGIYAEQHGLHAIILEKNSSVGGLCTGWYRQGQYLDGCIHWLTGTKEGTDLNLMWKNAHAFKQEDIINLPSWGTFEYEGQKVSFLADIEKAEEEWIKVSPVDKKQIHKFFKIVSDFTKVDTPVRVPVSKLPFKDLMKMGLSVLKVFPSYVGSMYISCEEYAKRFKSKAIQHALVSVQPGDGNLFSMVYSYSTIVMKNGGYPMGGSKKLVESMKEHFLSLGGTLKLNTSVEEVIIEKKMAKGVITNKGEKVYGDYLVPALDTNYFLTNILKNKYPKPDFDKRIFNYKKYPTPLCAVIYLEVDQDPHLEDYIYSIQCDTLKVAMTDVHSFSIRNYDYDVSMKKDNKTILGVLIDQFAQDYYFWSHLYESDREAYRLYKENLANEIIARIIARFPELNGHIKTLDVVTPKTYNRYCNVTRGSFMSFLFTKNTNMYWNSGRIRNLNNVYLASQWMEAPGGLPFAICAGNYAIQRICEREKIKVLFSIPETSKETNEQIYTKYNNESREEKTFSIFLSLISRVITYMDRYISFLFFI